MSKIKTLTNRNAQMASLLLSSLPQYFVNQILKLMGRLTDMLKELKSNSNKTLSKLKI